MCDTNTEIYQLILSHLGTSTPTSTPTGMFDNNSNIL